MRDRAAFLRAICDAPDNDAPRLVFADWLDEQGDPDRAEFIRLQCAADAAQRHEPFRDPFIRRRGSAGDARSAELLGHHRDAWLADLPAPLRRRAIFARGFPAVLSCRSTEWLRHGTAARRVAPLRELWLDDPHGLWHRLAAARTLAGIAGLAVVDGGPRAKPPAPADFAALADSPHLTDLRHLRLGVGPLTASAVAELACAAWHALETLSVGGNHLDDEAALPFVPLVSAVRVLEVGNSPDLTAVGLAALVEATRRLEQLSAANTRAGPALASLAASPVLAGLRWLEFSNTGVGEDGVAALARSPVPLEWLDLGYNRIGDPAAEALAAAPFAAALVHLDLSKTDIGPVGGLALARSPGLSRVRRLCLTGTRVGPAADALRERFGERVILDRPA